jgi:mannosyltransferase OCH1-like enzyme
VTNIFQILISDEPTQSYVPPQLERCVQTLKTIYPNHRHQLLRNDEIRGVLGSRLPPDVLRAYDCLKPYSYKADLAKFALIYLFGGWYYDVGLRPVAAVPNPRQARLLAFTDSRRHTRSSWSVQCGMFYAELGYPALKLAIDIVIENCRNKYYGVTPLCPTGPTVLGRAVAMHGKLEEYCIGEFRTLTPDLDDLNRSYLTEKGQLVALAKPTRGGDLASLGYRGVNNYNDFWIARNVYSES